jgi:hypothetical protein
MKGGSKASELVMATNPKLCDGKVNPVITGKPIEGNVENFSLYKTTGGGKRKYKKSNNSNNNNSNKSKKSKRSVKKVSNKKNKKSKGKKGRRSIKGGSLASDRVHAGVNNNCLPENTMKGGRKLRRKNKKSKSLRKSKKLLRRRKQRGSGSDWKMTLYSRGPVNTPTQNPEQFRMFTQTAEFIPNESLRAGKFGN